MDEILKTLRSVATGKKSENKKFFNRLKTKNPKETDRIIHHLHNKTFSGINCLDCANCCKTTGPLFTEKDIERISSKLKMKAVAFIEKYLRIDEDQDYVLKQVPCIFLGNDNSCSIYEFRPKACREFPHTDRIKQHQLFNLTIKNTEVCPAVFEIVEELKKVYGK